MQPDAIEQLLATWTFPGWRFVYLSTGGRLAKNRGIPCLEFSTDGTAILNAQIGPRSPSLSTVFQMEAPFEPETEVEARHLAFGLIRWVMIHEAAEFFQENRVSVFDPHDNRNAAILYDPPIPIPWQEGE
jgi:hypothetical protein